MGRLRALRCRDEGWATRGTNVFGRRFSTERSVRSRALLELSFEQVIISHGEPVHCRAEYEKSLQRDPWWGV